jgi:hypothetical protein
LSAETSQSTQTPHLNHLQVSQPSCLNFGILSKKRKTLSHFACPRFNPIESAINRDSQRVAHDSDDPRPDARSDARDVPLAPK